MRRATQRKVTKRRGKTEGREERVVEKETALEEYIEATVKTTAEVESRENEKRNRRYMNWKLRRRAHSCEREVSGVVGSCSLLRIGWVKRVWARIANESGNMKERVIRLKARGARVGIVVDSWIREIRERCCTSSCCSSMVVAGFRVKDGRICFRGEGLT
ncbi:hypothetical protein vseg_003605 [Gypsophila vaccaria]